MSNKNLPIKYTSRDFESIRRDLIQTPIRTLIGPLLVR